MAPPARHTKSAEWALTTSAVLLVAVVGGEEERTPEDHDAIPFHKSPRPATARPRAGRAAAACLGVKALDGLKAPGLALPALRLRPGDRLPVRRQHRRAPAFATSTRLPPGS